jgi:hypothetical protein
MASLEAETRMRGTGEWGLTLEVAGHPLPVGVAARDGRLERPRVGCAPLVARPGPGRYEEARSRARSR